MSEYSSIPMQRSALPRSGSNFLNDCPCVAFVNNNTVCQSCNHGEMYHRSRTEAPLALSNVPGSGMCAHCSLPITGAGFSGWYKEDKCLNIGVRK